MGLSTRQDLTIIIAIVSWFISTSIGDTDNLHRFGYIPTEKSRLSKLPVSPQYRGFLPVSVDLTDRFPTVGDQRNLNSCVGWAVGYAARSYYAVVSEGRAINNPDNIPSPSFIYGATRNSDDCQSGTYIPDALELLKSGSLSLSDMPYTDVCQSGITLQFDKATDFTIDRWLRVNPENTDDVKSQIAQRHPVIFGMMVTSDFLKLKGDRVYSQRAGALKGHAMTIVGYDDRLQSFRIINSWGSEWGDNGFGWISYNTFRQYVREAYAIRVVTSENLNPTSDPKVIVVEPPKPSVDEETTEPIPTDIPVPTPRPQETEIVVRPADDIIQLPEDLNDNCSKLQQSHTAGHVQISGFVGSHSALQSLKKAFPSESHDIDVELRPWPQCEVLLTLGERLSAADRPKFNVSNNMKVLRKGDHLVFEVVSPKIPAYMYISYVQADGSVITLYQPPVPALSPSRTATRFLFGDGGKEGTRFEIAAPFGSEMVIVVASTSPLFAEGIPDKQTERAFLSELRKALIYKADPSLPDREVTAAYFGLLTKEQ